MGITIADIAKAVGVSPTTVSLVLNNKPGASQELREKILKTANECNYTVKKKSVKAGSLCFLHIARHGHTVNRDHDVFIADYIEGLSQAAKIEGYSLEIMMFKLSPINTILQSAASSNAEGFIVLGTELTEEEVLQFKAIDKPFVFIDTYHEFIDFDFVDMNNEESIFMMLKYLFSMGHRNIGFVKAKIETRNIRLREMGYLRGLRELGLPENRDFIYSVDQTFHGAYEDMKEILSQHSPLPTALICGNDIIASGCLRAFSEAGIKIPDELSIVGFDNIPLSSITNPPLTTIQVSKSQIGRMAIQLLLTRIRNGKDMPSVKVLIGGKLVTRNSVKQLAI